MTHPHHSLIVGGGIIGLSIAWNMARHGCRVTLLERNRVGRATSWAGAGILPPADFANATDPIDRLRGLSHELFPKWAHDLETFTGIDCGLRRCGGWYLADTPGERAAMLGMTGYWNQLGIECEPVPAEDLPHREPVLSDWALRQGITSWWVPDEYQLRSPRYLNALHQGCLDAGVRIEEETEVMDVRETGQSAQVLVQESWRTADSVVLCCGAWLSQIASSIKLQRSVIPIRGQMLLLKTPSALSKRVINVGQRYLVFREDGHILVGSCEEEAGFELATTERMLRSLREFAISVVPSLDAADQVGSWSGLRPLTFDGFPMIGRVPDCSHVYVAGGHFRSGLHLSTGTASVITDLILGRDPIVPLDAFRIGKQQTQITSTIQ